LAEQISGTSTRPKATNFISDQTMSSLESSMRDRGMFVIVPNGKSREAVIFLFQFVRKLRSCGASFGPTRINRGLGWDASGFRQRRIYAHALEVRAERSHLSKSSCRLPQRHDRKWNRD